MQNPSSRWLGALLLVAPGVAAAQAADGEEGGRRGFFIGTGGGVQVFNAVDADGRESGTFVGGGGHLRLGEEVIPRLTLGLEFSGGSGTGNAARADFEAGTGGFFLQVTWRPPILADRLVVLLGTGLGGGTLTPDAEEGLEGTAAGAMHQAGFIYELDLYGVDDAGWTLAPSVRWNVVPDVGTNETFFSYFTIGVEGTWYAGR